jgi:hypothetical protein
MEFATFNSRYIAQANSFPLYAHLFFLTFQLRTLLGLKDVCPKGVFTSQKKVNGHEIFIARKLNKFHPQQTATVIPSVA